MGYYSDVRLTLTTFGYDKLKNYVEKYLQDRNAEDDNLLISMDLFRETDDLAITTYVIGWNDRKWYENYYQEVDAIMTGLNYLKENGYSFVFQRMGEDYDDYEEIENVGKYEGYLSTVSIERRFEDYTERSR